MRERAVSPLHAWACSCPCTDAACSLSCLRTLTMQGLREQRERDMTTLRGRPPLAVACLDRGNEGDPWRASDANTIKRCDLHACMWYITAQCASSVLAFYPSTTDFEFYLFVFVSSKPRLLAINPPTMGSPPIISFSHSQPGRQASITGARAP